MLSAWSEAVFFYVGRVEEVVDIPAIINKRHSRSKRGGRCLSVKTIYLEPERQTAHRTIRLASTSVLRLPSSARTCSLSLALALCEVTVVLLRLLLLLFLLLRHHSIGRRQVCNVSDKWAWRLCLQLSIGPDDSSEQCAFLCVHMWAHVSVYVSSLFIIFATISQIKMFIHRKTWTNCYSLAT